MSGLRQADYRPFSRTGFLDLSVTIPEGASHGALLDFELTVRVRTEASTDMDTGTGTVRIEVVPASHRPKRLRRPHG